MGYVAKTYTECVPIGEDAYLTESIHFEAYEDFIDYESKAKAPKQGVPAENKNNLYLTVDEIYTLRVLLGHVADEEAYRIQEKLDMLDEDELTPEDYDKLYFHVKVNGNLLVEHDGLKDVTIRFKEEE